MEYYQFTFILIVAIAEGYGAGSYEYLDEPE